jgi:hypothetical protein
MQFGDSSQIADSIQSAAARVSRASARELIEASN